MSTKTNRRLRQNLLNAICFSAYNSLTANASTDALKNAYLDKQQNVHIVTHRGQDIRLTTKRNATSVKIAPDNETAAWLVMNNWIATGDDTPGSEELAIYHSGKITLIKCRPFIRDYWFWNNGSQVAIDCGGRHFAGTEILYDSRTAKEISSFYQGDVPLEKRPNWSSGGN